MRSFGTGRTAAAAAWLGLGMALALGVAGPSGDASAASTSTTLAVQLGPQKTGSYGTVQVDQVSGGLEFRITLNPSVGPKADLHEFYFNLPDQIAGLHLSGSGCGGGSCTTPFELQFGKPTSGGAGARFDYRVNFGNGGSAKGNGNLQMATFRLDANGPLQLDPSPFDSSFTSRHLEVIFAAHVPGMRGIAATIGSTNVTVVPEPATAALFGLGLLGIAWAGRRRPS